MEINLINFLEEYDFEVCFCCMIMGFIVLTIIDKMIEKYKSVDYNRGILS